MEFLQNKQSHEDLVFCFYEGEDGKYYNLKIKNILGNNIFPIIVGNKKDTIQVWRMIKSKKEYASVRKMFFVDNDMDKFPEDKDSDLYITPCYSIENLYVQKQTLYSILEAEFSIRKSEEDFNCIIEKYDQLLEEFCENMSEFNALVLLRKLKEKNNVIVNITDIKTSKLITIDFFKIEKGFQYQNLINKLRKDIGISEDELHAETDRIRKMKHKNEFFRGKNQLDFFVKFIKILKERNEQNLFKVKRSAVYIDITKNRLSELSQYATVPNCLSLFIQRHSFKPLNHYSVES